MARTLSPGGGRRNVPLFLESLLILVQGMVGVFVVMAIIAIVIMLLNKLGSMKK